MSIVDLILQPPTNALLVLLALLLALLFARLLRARWRSWAWEWRLRRALGRIGRPVMRDLRLPDGLGGELRFDYALPTPAGVLLVAVRRYAGVIFGGAEIERWTQMLSGQSHPFPNPLRELAAQAATVKTLLGDDCQVETLLLFGPESEFPRGRPAGVVSLADLAARSAAAETSGSSGLTPAWESLLASRR
jgi:hypothetical protein